jgi:transposase
VAREWFEELDIKVIKFPPYSPDLNPIKHMWAVLKRKLNEMYPKLKDCTGETKADRQVFIDAAKAAWAAIDQSYINNLIDSMPRRIEAVIKAKGWQTRY